MFIISRINQSRQEKKSNSRSNNVTPRWLIKNLLQRHLSKDSYLCLPRMNIMVVLNEIVYDRTQCKLRSYFLKLFVSFISTLQTIQNRISGMSSVVTGPSSFRSHTGSMICKGEKADPGSLDPVDPLRSCWILSDSFGSWQIPGNIVSAGKYVGTF